MVNGGYRPEDSALARAQGETFVFEYGSGWASGEYYEDIVYFRSELVLPCFGFSFWRMEGWRWVWC